jgi:lysophospholipase L1-like esterase
MKKFRVKNSAVVLVVLLSVLVMGCSSDKNPKVLPLPDPVPMQYKYLALGDSYTIGESVCATCRFPEQLKDSIQDSTNSTIELRIIAQTGWTTTNLKAAIASEVPGNDYDMVTLLIGVNNQFQNKPFSLYEQEFPELVSTAIAAAKGDKNNVIVVSIPDYAFTPYGQQSSNPQNISAEIDAYNNFAQSYCTQLGISFINITDITRQGVAEPGLVASDGLHPSALAYTKFVHRLLPEAIEILQD